MSSGGSAGRRWVQILGLVLSVAAIAVLLRSVDVGETATVIQDADWRLLVLGAVIVLVQLVVVTRRWGLLLAGLSGDRIRASRLIGPVLLGYLGNFVLPTRLGELVRSFAVSRREGLAMSAVFGSVVLERVIDASVLAVLALGTALALGAPGWIFNVSLVAAIGGTLVLGILATPAAMTLADGLRHTPLAGVRTIGGAIEHFAGGAALRSRPLAVLFAGALSGASWLLEGSVYWLAAQSLSLDVSVAVAFLVAAVTVLATAVPSAPAYVGTFELTVVAVATAFGVPSTEALAWGLLAHAVTVAPLAIGGVATLILGGQRPADIVEEAEHAELLLEGSAAISRESS